MTEKATLLALAERCEKATGPDRELDAEIFLLSVAPDWRKRKDWRKTNGWFEPGDAISAVSFYTPDGLGGSEKAAAYTSSLDAAMTLVPEGAKVTTQTFGGPGPMALVDPNHRFCSAATLALALTAACLRARAA